ncbi:MAG: hypothetical protein ABIH23_26945 [bacterium]
MNTATLLSSAYSSVGYGEYQNLSFVQLIEHILYESDSEALRHLWNDRPLFRGENGQRVRFIEFVTHLFKVAERRGGELAKRAYDLTIDKFSHLPDTRSCESIGVSRHEDHKTDCRFYFRAFLERMEKEKQEGTYMGQIEEEELAARVLQGLVRRHFSLSMLECMRETTTVLAATIGESTAAG